MLLPWDELTKFDLILGALGCCLAVQLVVRTGFILQGPRLPPGPQGNLFLGNLLDMPTHHEWKTFAGWAKEFGNLISVKVFTQRLILINSIEIAHDLFEKRSSLYSDRTDLPMLNDLMGFDWNFGMMRYGERWRRHRRMFYEHSHPSAAEGYLDIQLRQTRAFLPRLCDAPNEVLSHFRYLAGAFILEIAYGIKAQPKDDPYIGLAEKAVDGLIRAGAPGAFLVDVLPILKYIPEWVPGATFRKKARIWREYVIGMCCVPFKAVKDALHAGTANSSMAATLLEELARRTDAPEDEEEVIRNTTAVAYLGGTDTVSFHPLIFNHLMFKPFCIFFLETSTALSWFMLAMVIYPEVQKKAQAEIDSIVESDRLPEFEDRKHLPYIDAICKESLRWNPVAPLAIGHRVTEDNIYGEFLIPKGSIALGNAWAMLHDEKIYGPNPNEFQPERFLKPGVPDPIQAFGFGRRICPGRYIADNFMFIVIASILKVYDIMPAKDGNGDPIPVEILPTPGVVAGPHPFKCAINPRSDFAERLLSEIVDD